VASPARALLVAVLSAAAPSLADDRYDHRGAVGLIAALAFQDKDSIVFNQNFADSGSRYAAEIGGTYAVGYNGNELALLATLGVATYGSLRADWGLAAGYRGYFGHERFKTYFDLDAAVHFTPSVTAGPRFGAGVQYELTQTLGVFGGLEGELCIGPQELRLSAQIAVGFQFRSYLLE
jgi:hypothetical protein